MRGKKSFLIRCLLPAVLIYSFSFLYPTIKTIIMSFFNMKTIATPVSGWTFQGLNNYFHIFTSSTFWASLRNIGKIWIIGGAMTMFFAIVFAVILTGDQFPGKRMFRTIVYLPNVISIIALGNMWLQYVYNAKFGMLTKLFSTLGMEKLASTVWTAPEHIFIAICIALPTAKSVIS